MPILLILILLPFLELAVFARIGEEIGIWNALGLTFLSGILGLLILRYQGLHTFLTLRAAVDRGETPLREIFDGFCLFSAGILLLLPGFVTDIMGLALLLPVCRGLLHHGLGIYNDRPKPGQADPYNPDIIEGEFTRMDEDDHDKLR